MLRFSFMQIKKKTKYDSKVKFIVHCKHGNEDYTASRFFCPCVALLFSISVYIETVLYYLMIS